MAVENCPRMRMMFSGLLKESETNCPPRNMPCSFKSHMHINLPSNNFIT